MVFLLLALFIQVCSCALYMLLWSFEVVRSELVLVFCTISFSFFCRSKKYGPIIRVNAFHRVSVLILSPEGVKVLQNKTDRGNQPLPLKRVLMCDD